MKLSVVITVYNEEQKIEDCLKSIKDLADEIIVVNNNSTDKTLEIAKKYTDIIYNQPNNPQNIDLQKNLGISKATCEWILVLDADERVEQELADEIRSLDEKSDFSGYNIARKNIIFGKWIAHTGWYPDYQLRLFKKGKGKFEEKHVHQSIKIEGEVGYLKNSIKHLNYESVSQFLDKIIKTYTVSEAQALIDKGYTFQFSDVFKMPLKEFYSRYLARQGYKDGMHGLSLSLLMAFYHFVVFLRLWEKNDFAKREKSLDLFQEGLRYGKKETSYWLANEKINEERNLVKKQLLKVIRKVNS